MNTVTTTYIAIFSTLMFTSVIDALPLKTYKKVKDKGYILVDKVNADMITPGSKDRSQVAGSNRNCDFEYVVDEETSRIPPKLNVAVLKNSAHEKDCEKLTYDFTVLEQCVDCDAEDKHGIIYKISRQTKVVGFIKI